MLIDFSLSLSIWQPSGGQEDNSAAVTVLQHANFFISIYFVRTVPHFLLFVFSEYLKSRGSRTLRSLCQHGKGGSPNYDHNLFDPSLEYWDSLNWPSQNGGRRLPTGLFLKVIISRVFTIICRVAATEFCKDVTGPAQQTRVPKKRDHEGKSRNISFDQPPLERRCYCHSRIISARSPLHRGTLALLKFHNPIVIRFYLWIPTNSTLQCAPIRFKLCWILLPGKSFFFNNIRFISAISSN